MQFQVPATFQNELIPLIKQEGVTEVYGKLPKDVIGGGRPFYALPQINRKVLRDHIKALHANGLAFNYPLNATCLGNLEYTEAGRKKIFKFLDFLADAGVDSITVAMPYLFELIKKHYPRFSLYASAFANINSVVRAKFWEDLGAPLINLMNQDVTRDFQLIGAIRKNVRCRLQLLANDSCLESCPMSFYHENTTSFISQLNAVKMQPSNEYCRLYCHSRKLIDPVNLLSSEWIRPEDIHYYEEAGIDSLKICDRTMPSEVIIRTVKAYTERRYDGNFMDLFSFFKRTKIILSDTGIKNKNLGEGIYINNRKLDGLINYYLEGDRRLSVEKNHEYCKKWVNKNHSSSFNPCRNHKGFSNKNCAR